MDHRHTNGLWVTVTYWPISLQQETVIDMAGPDIAAWNEWDQYFGRKPYMTDLLINTTSPESNQPCYNYYIDFLTY